jgi:IS30 family transposase
MLEVANQYRIRQAYYNEKKSRREIARELGYSRNTVKKAIEQDEPGVKGKYRQRIPAAQPRLILHFRLLHPPLGGPKFAPIMECIS